jgi:hypothetical protein
LARAVLVRVELDRAVALEALSRAVLDRAELDRAVALVVLGRAELDRAVALAVLGRAELDRAVALAVLGRAELDRAVALAVFGRDILVLLRAGADGLAAGRAEPPRTLALALSFELMDFAAIGMQSTVVSATANAARRVAWEFVRWVVDFMAFSPLFGTASHL